MAKVIRSVFISSRIRLALFAYHGCWRLGLCFNNCLAREMDIWGLHNDYQVNNHHLEQTKNTYPHCYSSLWAHLRIEYSNKESTFKFRKNSHNLEYPLDLPNHTFKMI